MTSAEWMEGKGQSLTFDQARRELLRHGYEPEQISRHENHLVVQCQEHGEPITARLDLNSKAILEWLGY